MVLTKRRGQGDGGARAASYRAAVASWGDQTALGRAASMLTSKSTWRWTWLLVVTAVAMLTTKLSVTVQDAFAFSGTYREMPLLSSRREVQEWPRRILDLYCPLGIKTRSESDIKSEISHRLPKKIFLRNNQRLYGMESRDTGEKAGSWSTMAFQSVQPKLGCQLLRFAEQERSEHEEIPHDHGQEKAGPCDD